MCKIKKQNFFIGYFDPPVRFSLLGLNIKILFDRSEYLNNEQRGLTKLFRKIGLLVLLSYPSARKDLSLMLMHLFIS